MSAEHPGTQPDPVNQPAPQQADSIQSYYEEVRLSQAWMAPLPPPNLLATYDKILPGAAERIFVMAEREQNHRHAMERNESKLNFTGLIVGAMVAIAALVAGTFVIFLGHEIAGTVIVGVDLVGLAGVFVYGSRSNRREEYDEGTEPDS